MQLQLCFQHNFYFSTNFRLSTSKDAPHNNIPSDLRLAASQGPGIQKEMSCVQHVRLRRPLVGEVRVGKVLVGGHFSRVVSGRVQHLQPELLGGILREEGRCERYNQQGVDQVLRRELVQHNRREVAKEGALGQEPG